MKLLVGLFLLYLAYRVVRRLFSQKDVSKRPEPTFRHDILNADESAPAPSSRSRKKPTQWYGKDRRVTVQGYDIPGGLIYVGEHLPDIHGYGDDACLINPRLKVSPAEPWEAGDEYGLLAEVCDDSGKVPRRLPEMAGHRTVRT